jgi:hypothetical protein
MGIFAAGPVVIGAQRRARVARGHSSLPARGAALALAHQGAQAPGGILHAGRAGDVRDQFGNVAGRLVLGRCVLGDLRGVGRVHAHGLVDERSVGGDPLCPLRKDLPTTNQPRFPDPGGRWLILRS